MSERIIREGVQKLGISPNDPDYIQLITLLRNMVTDIKQGRTTLVEVERFFNKSRDMIETLIASKNLNISVDDAINMLLDIVRMASMGTGASLLDMYMKTMKGIKRGKQMETIKKEEKEDSII